MSGDKLLPPCLRPERMHTLSCPEHNLHTLTHTYTYSCGSSPLSPPSLPRSPTRPRTRQRTYSLMCRRAQRAARPSRNYLLPSLPHDSRNGSVVCDYKIHYILKEGFVAVPFVFNATNVTDALDDGFKTQTGVLFQKFIIAVGSHKAKSKLAAKATFYAFSLDFAVELTIVH